MKLKILTILTIFFLSISASLAQNKKVKKEKKKENKNAPELKIAPIEETPPIIIPAPIPPQNGSLFSESSSNANLLRDFKARQVGDLVFVDVVEQSKATVESSAKRNRDSGNLGGLVPLVNALPVNGAATVGAVLPELGKRKFEGTGTTERTSKINARITARVVEVLPNGDLRIQAVKMVKINKETEQLAVTGIVRPNNLSKDNSIDTNFIGDLRVEINGKGIASADNAPGWLFRVFDKLSPF